ncbi:cold shock and DUF1294 domain-containing protein [bacterium]|nr:cold shock and DUF1294 domain-containing protein [bacterium]
MLYQGNIKKWNDDKGFGFVQPNGGGDQAFVHIKSFVSRSRRPVNGDAIVYEVVQGSDRRYKAIKINFLRDAVSRNKRNSRSQNLGSVIAIGFCILLVILAVLEQLPYNIAGAYFFASLISFFLYAFDKSSAKNNKWRIKESTLHLFDIIGGWPGALYAQNKLRHKSNKKKFKNVFWVTVIINLAAFFLLLAESNRQLIESIIGG